MNKKRIRSLIASFVFIFISVVLYSCDVIFDIATKDQDRVILIHTSDVHSRIDPVDKKGNVHYNRGGFARRANYLDTLRYNNKNVLLFDCGDISQGTPYYNIFKGELEIKLMNEMGYDAMTIGNHEFDFGMENLARIFSMAKFPIVCANYDVENSLLKGLVKPYTIINKGGLKIGVFGIGVDPKGLIQDYKCKGVVFKDIVETANNVAKELKQKDCDLVICLSHIGIEEDKKMISNTNNIDIVLGGHSHTFLDAPLIMKNVEGKDVLLSHVGKNGVRMSRIDILTSNKGEFTDK